MRNKEFSLLEIKRFLKSKGLIIRKNIYKKKTITLNTLSKTFLSSLIIISFFFVLPLAIDLTNKKILFSKNYENTSKNNLNKLLENQDPKLDNDLDKKSLFEDIFTFDQQPKDKDSVRLSASTIEELFKSTNYKRNQFLKKLRTKYFF